MQKNTETIHLVTEYRGATDTRGASIRVIIPIMGGELSRSYAYDYAAPNPHIAAVMEFLGRENSDGITPVEFGDTGNVYRVEYVTAGA